MGSDPDLSKVDMNFKNHKSIFEQIISYPKILEKICKHNGTGISTILVNILNIFIPSLIQHLSTKIFLR